MGTEMLASGATPTPASAMRVQVEGANPTTLRMKVWNAVSGTEPAAWQYTATDSAGPQGAGNVGVRTYMGGAVTNAPRTVRVDDLTVDDMTAPPTGDPVLMGAGDIAYTENGDTLTAAIVNANPGALVYTTGDNAYQNGSASDFATYYEPTWGAFKNRTRFPVVGQPRVPRPAAPPVTTTTSARTAHGPLGYWSDDTVSPSWHIVVLNSNCGFVSCAPNSTQVNWLRADLAANTKPCTVALWHHPRFSSGDHGNDATVAAFWDELHAAGAELVLNGHDHNYERFNPQTPAAVASPDRHPADHRRHRRSRRCAGSRASRPTARSST